MTSGKATHSIRWTLAHMTSSKSTHSFSWNISHMLRTHTWHSFSWHIPHMVSSHTTHCRRWQHFHMPSSHAAHSVRWHHFHMTGSHATHSVGWHCSQRISIHVRHSVRATGHDLHPGFHVNEIHIKSRLVHKCVCSITTSIKCGSKSTFRRISISYRLVESFHSCVKSYFKHFGRHAKILSSLSYCISSRKCCLSWGSTIRKSILECCHSNFIHIRHLVIKHLSASIHPDVSCLIESSRWVHSA